MGPLNVVPTKVVLCRALLFHENTVVTGEGLDLVDGYRMEPTLGVGRAASQGDGQKATRSQEGDQLAKSPGTVGWLHVHPDGAKKDDVEGQPGLERPIECWQRVRNPLNRTVAVTTLADFAHRRRRLNRNYLVAFTGQPSGIPTAACTNVEDGRRSRGQEPLQPGVNPLCRRCLIPVREFLGADLVPLDCIDQPDCSGPTGVSANGLRLRQTPVGRHTQFASLRCGPRRDRNSRSGCWGTVTEFPRESEGGAVVVGERRVG